MILVVAVVVIAVAVGAVLFVRARQVERSTEALCTELTAADGLDESLTTLDPTTLEPQVAALEKASDVAPTEIAPAVRTLADYVGGVATDIEGAPDPQAALTEALAARQDQVDAVTAAGTQVQQWAEVNCAIDLTGPGATAPSTSSTVPPVTASPDTEPAAATGSSTSTTRG